MRSRLRFWKYPIIIVLLLGVLAAFTLMYTLSDTAAAPHEQAETPDAVISEVPEPEYIEQEEEPEDEPEDEPEEEPEEVYYPSPSDDGFITININEETIHQGPLLLVNHDHIFTIPDDIDLVNIADTSTTEIRVQQPYFRLSGSIMEPLDEMMEAFTSATNSRSVIIVSAFRDFDYQQRLLANFINRMGRTMALQYASRPGHSEHHTGLAVDFGVMTGGTRGTFDGFGTTAWFRRNAYNYGFILRYPANKTRITQTSHEPWHFRYVGLPHSALLFQKGWVLEEFIENIREYTFEEPLEFEREGILYEMYFTTETEIKVPLNSEFDISGNNIDGFIVTFIRLEYDQSEITDVSI